MVFVIQPQVRYKAGSWWFALENAGTFNAPYQGSSSEVADADLIPDVTVRQVRLGVEYMYSYRGLEGDTNGAYHRIQLAAKYYFRYRNSIFNEKR